MKSQTENKLLSWVTFITSLGDFISLFAVLKIIHDLSGSVVVAAYAVPVQSLSILIGGLTTPRVMSAFSHRAIMIWTQLIAGAMAAILALYWQANSNCSTVLILTLLGLITVSKQYFTSAREAYSKGLGTPSRQRSLQAEIMSRFYSAQLVGPILSFFLIRFLPIAVPLWIDAASFFAAGLACMKLEISERSPSKLSISAPMRYIWKDRKLAHIFLVRAVGLWIPIGTFNYFLFSVVTDHYHLTIIHSAWIYSLIGLGSVLGSALLMSPDFWPTARISKIVSKTQDLRIAMLATILIGFTRIAFLKIPSIHVATFFITLGGVCNGINAITTQSVRRKVATTAQFPEVVGLELVVAKITDWGVSTLCFILLTKGWMTYEHGIWISAIGFWVLAFFMERKEASIPT
jgi:MFS family permease